MALSGDRLRIVVVGDHHDAADSFALHLRMAGPDTLTAYDGLKAVQTSVGSLPDVVFLDIGMPRMNRYEPARHIRNEPWG